MRRALTLTLLALAGCSEGPDPLTWEQAQALAARCRAKGLEPAYQSSLYGGAAVRWVNCIDPKTGALFKQDQE